MDADNLLSSSSKYPAYTSSNLNSIQRSSKQCKGADLCSCLKRKLTSADSERCPRRAVWASVCSQHYGSQKVVFHGRIWGHEAGWCTTYTGSFYSQGSWALLCREILSTTGIASNPEGIVASNSLLSLLDLDWIYTAVSALCRLVTILPIFFPLILLLWFPIAIDNGESTVLQLV